MPLSPPIWVKILARSGLSLSMSWTPPATAPYTIPSAANPASHP